MILDACRQFTVPVFAAALLAGSPSAQNCQSVTDLVSRSSSGASGNEASWSGRLSADGRYVVFTTVATNLGGAPMGTWSVYRRDRVTGETLLVSASAAGVPGNNDSDFASVSDDGRLVAFRSAASNLVPGDTNNASDIFVKDMQTGAIERVSVSVFESQANGSSLWPDMSGDGRYVVFQSNATNLLLIPETNGHTDIYLRDRLAGTTSLISVGPSGVLGDGPSRLPSISSDGLFVAYTSSATNLVPFDTNGVDDVFLRDRAAGVTLRASLGPPLGFGLFVQGNAESYGASVSDDGRWVAFETTSDNLVSLDGNGVEDIFVRDMLNGVTVVASNAAGPFVATSNNRSRQGEISGDGRYVVFQSSSTNLIPGQNWAGQRIYVRDLVANTTAHASVTTGGAPAQAPCRNPHIASGGGWVAFDSDWDGFASDDGNADSDVFVHGVDCTFPFTYGTAKQTSNGCLPSIAFSGEAKSSLSGGFVLFCHEVINQKPGLLFYGVSGPAALPFQGGTLNVQPPLKRSPLVLSNGNPPPANDCSGRFVLNMDAFASGALGGSPLLALQTAGTVVNVQWWGRDPGFAPPANTLLSDGLEYTVRP